MSGLKPGYEVNLESSLRAGGEIGGHFVFGHIDGSGIISAMKLRGGKNYEMSVRIKSRHRKYVIPAGAIAVNGVSLTVADVIPAAKGGPYFEIRATIIPYTYENTTFKDLKVNDKVNVEFDFMGKYVVNMAAKIR
jgi:riboflavin synthase